MKQTFTLLLLLFCFNLSAQSPWRSYVTAPNGYVEPDEAMCDVVQNGIFYLPPSLSGTNYYWTNLLFNDTICVGNEFIFEIRLTNPQSLGGIDAYDVGLNILGDNVNAGASLMGAAWAQSYTNIYVGANSLSNQAQLVMDFDLWHTIRMTFQNGQVNYSYDGSNFFTMPYNTGICNIMGMALSFKGSGQIDYIRIMDTGNNLLWAEEFSDCNNMATGMNCADFYNVTANAPVCVGTDIELDATGNFANSTLTWTGPNSFSSNVEDPVIPAATAANAGVYSFRVTRNGCTSLPATVNVPVVVCDDPPVLVVTDTSQYCANSPCTPVAPTLTLTDPDGGTINGAKIYFNTGYVTGQDVLSFTTIGNITGVFDPATGVLTLTGAATSVEYQQALRSVCYQNNSATPSPGPREIYLVLSSLVFNQTNGHYYQLITSPTAVSWTQAQAAAAASTYYGMQGYLVTITSAAENAFLGQLIQANTWIGASDALVEGEWRWVTGCEGLMNGGIGQLFSTAGSNCSGGSGTGQPLNGLFVQWTAYEPNDAGCNEDYAHFWGSNPNTAIGDWNDFPLNGNSSVFSYIIEYGCMPNDPVLQVQGTAVINVAMPVTSNVAAIICQGDSYTRPAGTVETTSGTYTDNLLTIAGCDSIVITQLTVNPVPRQIVLDTICQGETYTLPGGAQVTIAGTYIDTFATWLNCDSIITTNLVVNPTSATSIVDTICADALYTLPDGSTTNVTGIYIDTFANVHGCDSIVTVNLTVNPVYNVPVTTAICDNETYTLPDGVVVNAAAVYTTILPTINGCDSTIVTTLTVNPTYSADIYDTICAGESYTLPDGLVTGTAGIYRDTFATINGCDSIINTFLTVNPVSRITLTPSICANQQHTLPDGTTTSTAGTYIDTFANRYGCDSIITTILTVHPIYNSTENIDICDNQTYRLPDNTVVNTTGTYTSSLLSINGCDSIIVTNLTVHLTYYPVVWDTICEGSSYTLPDGSTVTAAGSYVSLLSTSTYGCDSNITTRLAVIDMHLTEVHTDVTCFDDNDGTIDITVTGGVLPANYIWSNSGMTGPNQSGLGGGTYGVTCVDAFGCTRNMNITIAEPPLLELNATGTDVSCFAAGDGSIAITYSGGTAPLVMTMDGATITGTNIANMSAGTYELNATDANGCVQNQTVYITEPDSFTLTVEPDTMKVILGDTMELNVSSNHDPAAEYLWRANEGLSCLDCNNPTLLIYSSDSLHLQVSVPSPTISGATCIQEYTLPVTVIDKENLYIPNAFSPNGDAKNPDFRIYGNLNGLRYYELIIYNRWGDKVFESKDPNQGWDGTHRGTVVEPGVFTYYVKLAFHGNGKAMKDMKGSITVIR